MWLERRGGRVRRGRVGLSSPLSIGYTEGVNTYDVHTERGGGQNVPQFCGFLLHKFRTIGEGCVKQIFADVTWVSPLIIEQKRVTRCVNIFIFIVLFRALHSLDPTMASICELKWELQHFYHLNSSTFLLIQQYFASYDS